MKVLRTPDSRFNDLPDYPFSPNYYQVTDQLRMHYLDEGRPEGEVVLMLHGEPSWSFLYRHMIPVCANAGHRVIAPDLIGFGKSDKPTHIDDYTYQNHLDWVWSLIEELNLTNITLVCQDWGGLLGLRLVAEHPDRFARVVVGNSMLPTGEHKVPPVFKAWKAFAVYSPLFPIARIVEAGSAKKFSKEELRAYDAPFPSKAYKAGTRAFPKLVPIDSSMPEAAKNKAAWEVLDQWEKPFLTTFSSGDPIMRGGDKLMQKRIPGTKGQKHITLRGGHFLQEDSGPAFAEAVNQFIADNPIS